MKRVIAAIGLLIATVASAQQYSIDWYKIAGGGGTSTGGVYSVSGTIGQHDAGGPMTGGNYSLTGGFWSLLSVVQVPGAPTLNIKYTTTNTAVIYWSSTAGSFSLQQNADLTQTLGWGTPGETVSDNGTNKFIIVSPPSGKRFFRLKFP